MGQLKEVLVKGTVQVGILALILFAPLSARAQDSIRLEKIPAKTVKISGTVGVLGKSLVSDKGNRVWKVANPEVLAATEGRHVVVKAQVNLQSNELSISVVRLQEARTTPKLDDVAFRR